MSRRPTESEWLRARKMWCQHLGARQIADALGVTPDAVYRRRAADGWPSSHLSTEGHRRLGNLRPKRWRCQDCGALNILTRDADGIRRRLGCACPIPWEAIDARVAVECRALRRRAR